MPRETLTIASSIQWAAAVASSISPCATSLFCFPFFVCFLCFWRNVCCMCVERKPQKWHDNNKNNNSNGGTKYRLWQELAKHNHINK